MNLLLTIVAMSAIPALARHRLVPLALGLAAFSTELQIATITGWATASSLIVLNVAAAAMAIAVNRRGLADYCSSCLHGWRGERAVSEGNDSRPPWTVIVAGLTILAAVPVLVRGLLYVPLATDEYHLMKVSYLAQTGTLAYVPVVDTKINVLSSLYELALFDLRSIPFIGEWLFRLHGVLLMAAYAAIVAAYARRRPRKERYLWLTLAALPPLFHQFVGVKNDVASLALGVLALTLLFRARERDDVASRTWWMVGFVAGLTVAVKLTNLPLALIVLLFCARRDRIPWHTQILATASGLVIGLAAGGFFFNLYYNLVWYHGPLGPISGSDNLPADIRASVLSLARFIISLGDWGLLTPTVWPGRGGWGSNLGPVFASLVVVVALDALRPATSDPLGQSQSRRSVDVLIVTMAWMLAFGAAYPDADIAHRMILAPAVFLSVHAVRLLGRPSPVMRVARPIVMVLAGIVLVQEARSGVKYLAQLEYLRSPALMARAAPIIGTTPFMTTVWQERQINARARPFSHVANFTAEHFLLLDGVPFAQAAAVVPTDQGYRIAWQLPRVMHSDFIILGPNDYPPSAAAEALVSACRGEAPTTIIGAGVPLAGVTCGSDDRVGGAGHTSPPY